METDLALLGRGILPLGQNSARGSHSSFGGKDRGLGMQGAVEIKSKSRSERPCRNVISDLERVPMRADGRRTHRGRVLGQARGSGENVCREDGRI